MTEDDAKRWLKTELCVSRETQDLLECFVDMVLQEMPHQNLISALSAEQIWSRHVVDSAQLLTFIPSLNKKTEWLDLGTGAGFPGIVIAILAECKVTMVESRNRRIEFLEGVIAKLGLSTNSRVIGARLETIQPYNSEVISARAFAPLDKIITLANEFSTEKTVCLLPKGKNAVRELEELPLAHQKLFHVEQSLTDSEAKILVAKGRL